MTTLPKNILVNDIPIDIHSGPIGLLHSGGADSAILLYIMMKHSIGPIHVFTCANKLKGRINPKIASDVIGRCIDLTANQNVFHHTYYVEEQTFDSLFQNANKFLHMISYMYTGVTAFPPIEVLKNLGDIPDIFNKRDPEEKRPLYNGKYYAPFFNHNKKDIYDMYKKLDLVDNLFPLTRSCEDFVLRSGHCGVCWWCKERHWAFGRLE